MYSKETTMHHESMAKSSSTTLKSRCTFPTLWIAALLLIASVPNPTRAEESGGDLEAAQVHHDRGLDHYRQARYAEALAEFEAAHEIAPTPANLFNLARCFEQLRRFPEAIDTLDRYLLTLALDEERRERAQLLRDRLAATPGRADVRSDPSGAVIRVDGQPEGITPGNLELPPGRHQLELRLEGHLAAQRELEIEPGSQQEFAIELTPEVAPEPPEPLQVEPESHTAPERSSPWPWVLTGAGLALAGTGVGLDLGALRRSQSAGDFDRAEAYEAWESEVRSLAISGDVLLLAGAAAVVGGLVWLLIDRLGRRRHETLSSLARVRSETLFLVNH
jgi:tetratricopeptide (TPR) repeat protein